MKQALLTIVLMALMTAGANAEQRVIYGSDGRVLSRSVTGSNGSVTHYGSDGRIIGRESTTPSSTIVYDAAGRRIGSSSPPVAKGTGRH